MVVSKLNNTITYVERRAINDDDKGYLSCLYEIDILDHNVVICVGKEKHQYSNSKGITYYPIYLVADNKLKAQIGVFEMLSKDVIAHIDDDGDVLIEDLEPLLFKFVNKDFLDKSGSTPVYYHKQTISTPVLPAEKLLEEPEDEDDVKRVLSSAANQTAVDKDLSNIFEMDTLRNIPEMLHKETEEDAKQITKTFVSNPNKPWIQQFMENPFFDIVNNECNTVECAVRDAYTSIGHKTKADVLRKLVATNMSEEIYNDLLNRYLLLKDEIAAYDKDMREIKKSVALYKTRIEKSVNKDEQTQMLEQAEALKNRYKELGVYKKMADKDFASVNFMSNIKSFDAYVKHAENHGLNSKDTISILEEELSCKILVFNKSAYDQGDMLSVLDCGKNNALVSKPKHYIMLSVDMGEWSLISYKNKRIFVFDELPFVVKSLIVNKCLEKNAGNLQNNTDVRKYQRSIGIIPYNDDDDNDDDYTTDIFVYHGQCMKGSLVGDCVRPTHVEKYRVLERLPSWRRVLDDSSITPFKLDGKRWQSVEHYKQAAKFKKQNPEFYKVFSLDAETDISKDVKKARQAGGKSGKLRPKNITIDADYYGAGGEGRAADERFAALVAKFSNNEEARRILLATGSAQLRHYEKGQPLRPDTLLMKTRDAVK